MSTLPPSPGGGWRWPALRRTPHAEALAWWPGPLVRSWGLVAVGSLLLACMLCLGLLAHYSDADTLRDERRQQEMVAGFTARTLGLRIETYQRVLQSMGQGIHSSMLDTPYLLELLLREDAGYAGIFDTLVMTGRDGSMVSYAPSGGTPDGGSALRDALRRTLSDGKPQVTQLTVDDASEGATPQLGLVLTVPLRQADGAVRGVLAGLVRMGLSSLVPEPEDSASTQRWLLVDQDGLLLADSQQTATPQEPMQQTPLPQTPAPQPPAALPAAAAATPATPAIPRNVPAALGVSEAQWAGLSSSGTANADSQQWGHLLVTRVGLPLPRWQVVAVRDLSTRLLGMQRLTHGQWLALIGTAVAVAISLLGLLWWLSRPLVRLLRQGSRQRTAAQTGRPVAAPVRPGARAGDRAQAADAAAAAEAMSAVQTGRAPDEAAHLQAHWQALEQDLHHSQQQAGSLEAAVCQLLESMPGGAVWEQGDRLLYVSRRAAALLGRDAKSLQGTHLHQLLHSQPGARQWVESVTDSLISFGHFQGEVPWKLQPGLTRWLHLQGQCMQLPAQGNLWLLRDAEEARQHRRQARWQDAHDAGTGLPNQYTLHTQLQSWCGASSQAQQGQGLLWLDVDYFTALNATAGRAAGDEVLRQVAWLLQREQGAHGLAARVGADAFVLWLRPLGSEAAVQTLAWRLCTAVQEWAPRYGGQRFVLGLSVGWLWTQAADWSADQLLRTAEAACREAKRSGQGRAVQAQLPDVHRS